MRPDFEAAPQDTETICRDAKRISEGILEYLAFLEKQKPHVAHHRMRANAANANKT